jgi:hypothetical protein
MSSKTSKPWYLSKTIWAQVLAIVGIAVQTQTGWIIDPEIQGAILILVNLILRATTGMGLTAKAGK